MKMTAPRVLENQEIPCGGYVQRGGGPQKTYCHNDGKKKILCVWHQELQDAENRGYDRAVDVHARSCGTQPPAIAAPAPGKRSAFLPGTKVKHYGTVGAVIWTMGERYYMCIDKAGTVSLMPADVVEEAQ